MLEFCGEKGIKQEFSNARTPQQKFRKGSMGVLDDQLRRLADRDEATRKAAVSEKIATKKTHSSKQPSSTPISKSAEDIMTFRTELDALALKHLGPVPATAPTSTNPVNTGSINLNTAFEEVNTGNTEAISPSADHEEEVFSDADDDEMPEIRIYDKSSEGIFEKASYDDDGIISDFNNLPLVVFIVTQMDVKRAFLYCTIDEEVYVPHNLLGFVDPDHPQRFYKGQQVQAEQEGIYISPTNSDYGVKNNLDMKSTTGWLSISWSKTISSMARNRLL
ncbi:hypothetical protein Tco_0463053 [Tanacetum coccineum]